MGNRFAQIAPTPSVRAVQKSMGSSKYYDETREGEPYNQDLGPDETGTLFLRWVDTLFESLRWSEGDDVNTRSRRPSGPRNLIRMIVSGTRYRQRMTDRISLTSMTTESYD